MVRMDRKFLYVVIVVLCLHTTMAVSQYSTKATITVATLLQPPLVMKDPASGKYSGLMIDVLTVMGFEIESVKTMDDRTYGFEEVPRKLDDVVDEVKHERADVAIVLYGKTVANASNNIGVTYTFPVYNEGFIPIFKHPRKWSHLYSAMLTLIVPFSPGLWCLVIVMCVMTSAVLFLIRHMSPFEASKRDKPIPPKSNLMFAIGSLLGRDHREVPRSLSGRVVTCVWWIFSLMTAGAYVGGLVAIIYRMNPKINTLPFSTLDEMVRQDEVKVLVVKDSVTYDHFRFRQGPVWEMFHNQKEQLIVDSTDTALKMMAQSDGEYAFFLQETTAKHFINQPPCNKMQVTAPLGDIFYGFGCKKGSILCHDLENGILHLRKTRKIEELRDKYYDSKCQHEEHFSYQGLPFVSTFGVGDPTWLYPRTFNINRFGSAFILLGIGFGTTILLLIAEVIFAKWRGPQFPTLTGPGLNDDTPTQRLNDQGLTPHGS